MRCCQTDLFTGVKKLQVTLRPRSATIQECACCHVTTQQWSGVRGGAVRSSVCTGPSRLWGTGNMLATPKRWEGTEPKASITITIYFIPIPVLVLGLNTNETHLQHKQLFSEWTHKSCIKLQVCSKRCGQSYRQNTLFTLLSIFTPPHTGATLYL